MNNKVIAGVSALALLVTMAAGFAGSGTAPFRIEVLVDTTIFIPTICEDGGEVDNALEFEPGITGLNDPEAVPIDTCASGAVGDWNITMAGNVPLNLNFKLDNASPQGIEIALWGSYTGASNASPFTTNLNYFNLTTTDSNPTWAQNIPDGENLVLWQRVAANTSAIGDSSQSNAIIVTSNQA